MAYKKKITLSVAKALKPGELVWDTEITGFGIRCQRRDKVYIFSKRIKGRQRQITIGKHGEPWTVEMARDRARILLGAIAEGKDPAQIRDDSKSRPTISELCDRYIDEYAVPHKKPSSVETDLLNLKNHIKPLLGKRFVSDVSTADIDKFMRDVKAGKSVLRSEMGKKPVTGGPGAANRSLALLSSAFGEAIKWGWMNTNPARGVPKFKEEKKERFLSEIELAAIGSAIETLQQEGIANPIALHAIRLLIFTGARRGEVLSLKWSNIDFERQIILLEDSKTGAKPVLLNAPALEVLSTQKRQGRNPYVFPGLIENEHLKEIRKPWSMVKDAATLKLWRQDPCVDAIWKEFSVKPRRACSVEQFQKVLENKGLSPVGGVTDVRLHDLRHTFASVAAMGGSPLLVIAKLLGHKQASTTERYAHLADSPIKQANDAIGNRIHQLLNRGFLDTQSAEQLEEKN